MDARARRPATGCATITPVYAGHLDLSIPLWWTVDRVLTPARCAAYIERFERGQARVAPIIRADGVGVDEELRNNTRIMWDDRDEANWLLAQVASRMQETGRALPRAFHGGALAGANPRLRVYRYGPAQHHSAHWDTEHELDAERVTRMTLVVYLNDDFDGGETEFPELDVQVRPATGLALLFQHRTLHRARAVARGAKFVLRTDLVYRRA